MPLDSIAYQRPVTTRSAGVLMHLSSLPSNYGIGDAGPTAYAFVDFLKDAGQTWWQVLPLGPMGWGYSPYQTFSTFAGSALWISPDVLRKEGLLKASDLADYPDSPSRRVDYPAVTREKHRLLGIAFGRFLSEKQPRTFLNFEAEHQDWLEDYALFTTLQLLQRRALWTTWPTMLRTRQPEALRTTRVLLAEKILFQKFIQYLFFRQWMALKTYANAKGVRLIGQMPFFVPYDSADVWANPELFKLKTKMTGSPRYNWEAHKQEKFAWWNARVSRIKQLYDVVRLDRPFVAEELGKDVPSLDSLHEQFHFCPTRVLQFGFAGDTAQNPHYPSNHTPSTIVYTGTHDQNTIKGWFSTDASDAEINRVRKYIGRPSGPAHWQLIRMAYASSAGTAIIPMQDLMGLGPEARMNVPGRLRGNWTWRMHSDYSLSTLAKELRVQAESHGRLANG
jgi:4-alpha-glucanotransferase